MDDRFLNCLWPYLEWSCISTAAAFGLYNIKRLFADINLDAQNKSRYRYLRAELSLLDSQNNCGIILNPYINVLVFFSGLNIHIIVRPIWFAGFYFIPNHCFCISNIVPFLSSLHISQPLTVSCILATYEIRLNSRKINCFVELRHQQHLWYKI